MINSIFFFCAPVGPPENTGYEHQIVSLAEGLREIGISFYSNINYWRESNYNSSYLLKNSVDVLYSDCDVVVLSTKSIYGGSNNSLPKDLFDSNRKYKLVFIDDEDGIYTPSFDIYHKVDLVLKSHFSNKYSFPLNFKPWQFGLTNRVINAVKPVKAFRRENEILVNFRVHHSTREEATKKILPIIYHYISANEETEALTEKESDVDQIFWHQTGRRHYASYYKRLSQATACACFGGYFQKSLPFQNNKIGYYLRHLDYKFKIFKYNKVYQFDSWRFWESLAAGCCTFHINLEKYGAVLPVMPINGVHYIGVDFDRPALLEKQLAKGVQFLQQIGEQGREWVLENYSPKATAYRFINLIENV